MRYLIVLLVLIIGACTSQPGQKIRTPHSDFQEKFVSEYYSGVKRIDCLVDVDSPLVGFQDNFAYIKVQHQTDKSPGCKLDFQSSNVDPNLQAVQSTLQFACWMASFTAFANLFDYAAMDRLKISETQQEYVFQDGSVMVNFLKDLSVANILFKKDDFRIAVEYKLDANKKRKWSSSLMKAKFPGQEIDLESRVIPVYGSDPSWPESLEITSLGVRTELILRNCKKQR
jgi:hypothetical protein